jgi:hypothetical protein
MKAMSLKVKPGGGGSKARARRRRRQGSGAEAEDDDLEMQDKDIAAAASTSASAKIVPEEERGGKRPTRNCDNCRSALDDVAEEDEEDDVAEEGTAAGVADRAAGEEEGDGEWVAEPEPGVLMTLLSRPDGTNHLRKLRFREELFDGPRAAQRWWADNYDCIVELYSIVQSSGGSPDDDGGGAEDVEDDEPATPCQSEDDRHQRRRWQRLGCGSASTSGGPSSGSGSGSGGGSASTVGSPILGLVVATPNSSKNKSPGPPGRVQSHKHKCSSLHIN